MTNKERILSYLQDGRKHTCKEIARALNLKEAFCRASLLASVKEGAPVERTSIKIKLPNKKYSSYYFGRTDIKSNSKKSSFVNKL